MSEETQKHEGGMAGENAPEGDARIAPCVPPVGEGVPLSSGGELSPDASACRPCRRRLAAAVAACAIVVVATMAGIGYATGWLGGAGEGAGVAAEQVAAGDSTSSITVSVYVDSSRAASQGWPACMASTSVTLSPGASVYDALCATGVGVGGSSNYVRAINGLAEFACGSESGWLYFVNGSSPGCGCGSCLLYGGESISWVYTLSMGNDL